MTLVFSAIMAEFKIPASFLQENLVDKTCAEEAFEGAINCNLV